jgi:hypothetical protein
VSLLVIVLLLASLYYFWHPCCGSPFCCRSYDVPIVSAAVGLPHAIAGFTVFASIPFIDGGHTVLVVLLLLSFLLL